MAHISGFDRDQGLDLVEAGFSRVLSAISAYETARGFRVGRISGSS
jgi:hypothetical protein